MHVERKVTSLYLPVRTPFSRGTNKKVETDCGPSFPPVASPQNPTRVKNLNQCRNNNIFRETLSK